MASRAARTARSSLTVLKIRQRRSELIIRKDRYAVLLIIKETIAREGRYHDRK